jgi:hypothetical protein
VTGGVGGWPRGGGGGAAGGGGGGGRVLFPPPQCPGWGFGWVYLAPPPPPPRLQAQARRGTRTHACMHAHSQGDWREVLARSCQCRGGVPTPDSRLTPFPSRRSTGEGACHKMPGASRCPVPLVPVPELFLYIVYPKYLYTPPLAALWQCEHPEALLLASQYRDVSFFIASLASFV